MYYINTIISNAFTIYCFLFLYLLYSTDIGVLLKKNFCINCSVYQENVIDNFYKSCVRYYLQIMLAYNLTKYKER